MASIRERTSKTGQTTWAVLFRHGSKQTSLTAASRDEAEKLRDVLNALGVERGLKAYFGADDETGGGLTVSDLASRFLEWKKRDVTPRTHDDYKRGCANWIEPWFGHREADAVDEADVQGWVDHMAERLSPKSVADNHMLLHSMYQYGRAKTRQLVSHNPCLETELPKRTKKPPKGTTPSEWRAILRAAEERGSEAHDLILFMGSLGWRWSEAAALGVADVEDDGTHVWVDVTRVFRLVGGRQTLVRDAAKSYAGFRRTRVTSECAAMFRRRIVGKAPSDFVFTNSRGNHWNQTTFLRSTWPTLLKAAGVGDETRKPTPHWLRHMAVANMARAGIPMHEIQRIIGHENIATTNGTYGGLVATLSPQGVASLDAILADRRPAMISGAVVSAAALPPSP